MHVIVLVTCPDGETAERITGLILKERLAACVNAISGVSSSYRWKGKIERSRESILIIKTKKIGISSRKTMTVLMMFSPRPTNDGGRFPVT